MKIYTDDHRSISGRNMKPGDFVEVFDNRVSMGKVKVQADGTWFFRPVNALANGEHDYQIRAIDRAGTASALTPSNPFLVDTQTPDRPLITKLAEGDVALNSGAVINETRPTLSGEAEKGSTVKVYANGNLIGTTVASEEGRWSFTPTEVLAEGEQVFTATATDAAGFTSSVSSPAKLVIDVTAPSKPIITMVMDNEVGHAAFITNNGTSDDNTPDFIGKAEAYAIIKLYDGSTLICETIADQNGNWYLEVTNALDNGIHHFTVKATDAAGNTSVASDTFTFTVGVYPMATPVLERVQDNDGTVVVDIAKGATTDDNTSLLSGTAMAGHTMLIYDNGVKIGEALANAEGKWSFTVPAELSSGPHNITTQAVDGAGVISVKSAAMELTIQSGVNSSNLKHVADDTSNLDQGLVDDSDDSQNTQQPLNEQNKDVMPHTANAENLADLNNSPIVGTKSKLDALIFEGHGIHLDLTKLDTAANESVEKFDISSDGANQLTLSTNDILHLGEADLAIRNGKTQLIVDGDADDTLNVVEGSDKWRENGTTKVGDITYKVYDNEVQNASLLMGDKMQVELL